MPVLHDLAIVVLLSVGLGNFAASAYVVEKAVVVPPGAPEVLVVSAAETVLESMLCLVFSGTVFLSVEAAARLVGRVVASPRGETASPVLFFQLAVAGSVISAALSEVVVLAVVVFAILGISAAVALPQML